MNSTDNEDFRKQELVYLRDELNQFISLSSERTHRLIGHIILIWGGALLLFNYTKDYFMGYIFALFVLATIFFISIVVLYFLSLRNAANLKSMNRIAAYINIFYENMPGDGKIFWETALFEMRNKQNKNMEKLDKWYGKLKEEFDNRLNKEYFWLSVIAIIVTISLSIVFLCNHFKIYSYNFAGSDIFMIIVCIIYIIISFLLLPKIYNSSINSERGRYLTKYHLKFFLLYAIKTGYYTKEEAENKFKEIYKEIKEEIPCEKSGKS